MYMHMITRSQDISISNHTVYFRVEFLQKTKITNTENFQAAQTELNLPTKTEIMKNIQRWWLVLEGRREIKWL